MFPAKRTEHLEGRLEPGKKELVQTLILDSHKQKLVTDKYGLRLCSTSEALSLPALSLPTFFIFLFFFCTLDSNQRGLISGQSTIKFAFAPPLLQTTKHWTFLLFKDLPARSTENKDPHRALAAFPAVSFSPQMPFSETAWKIKLLRFEPDYNCT